MQRDKTSKTLFEQGLGFNRFLKSDCQLRIEYPLAVSKWLKGSLDYLLSASQSLLIVEAKKDDITRGFTQMAVELIALSQVEEQPFQYGAVTRLLTL